MNICRESCPIFNGICVPDECDIFKKQYSDLFDENSTLRNRITRLRLDVEINKNELISAIENNIKICNINFNYESEIKLLQKDVAYYTDQAFWAETALKKITEDRDSLLEQTVKLKKEIDVHLKYISELKDRYEDVRGR